MKLSSEHRAFAARLGHDFGTPEHLIRALTHGSFGAPGLGDNQRMEFLGDRVLGLVIAEALLEADKNASEGQIAPRYNALVRRETCAAVAREIELGAVLRLGRSEQQSGGRRKEALLADAMEAVIAAVWLDAGHMAARAMVRRLWKSRIGNVEDDARDAKTALQEWAQARGETPPAYTEVARDGPDHQPVFTIRVAVDTGASAEATAGSKRQAEQAAAAALLEKVTS